DKAIRSAGLPADQPILTSAAVRLASAVPLRLSSIPWQLHDIVEPLPTLMLVPFRVTPAACISSLDVPTDRVMPSGVISILARPMLNTSDSLVILICGPTSGGA